VGGLYFRDVFRAQPPDSRKAANHL